LTLDEEGLAVERRDLPVMDDIIPRGCRRAGASYRAPTCSREPIVLPQQFHLLLKDSRMRGRLR
jgi:hypothetical protein